MSAVSSPEPELARWRLHLLRAAYALIAIGLMLTQLPLLAELSPEFELMEGFVICMLSALCLLSFGGIIRPLIMLPVLLFEIIWKVIWLTLVGLPAFAQPAGDPAMTENLFACALVIPVTLCVPWDYVGSVIVRGRSIYA